MTAPRPAWRRPAPIPPWLAGVLTLGALLLTISLLPSLASGLTPASEGDRAPAPVAGGSGNGRDADAVMSRSTTAARDSGSGTATHCTRARRVPAGPSTPAPDAGTSAADESAKRSRTYGVDPSTLDGANSAVRRTYGVDPSTVDGPYPAARSGRVEAKRPCTDPLPRTGSERNVLLLAWVLLATGLSMLVMIGFTTDRPWPGRYVRRTRPAASARQRKMEK